MENKPNLKEELGNWVKDYKDVAERNALAETPQESSDYLISLFSSYVKSVENPYKPSTKIYMATTTETIENRAFESCRESILKGMETK